MTAQGSRRPVTVDDLMKLRAIVDVQISPDGERVAYVVSTPKLSRNEHDAALFVVPRARRHAATHRRGRPHLQHPRRPAALRWSPDGTHGVGRSASKARGLRWSRFRLRAAPRER